MQLSVVSTHLTESEYLYTYLISLTYLHCYSYLLFTIGLYYAVTIQLFLHTQLRLSLIYNRLWAPVTLPESLTSENYDREILLSEEQKFNGDNLLQWNTNITQLLGLKGLLGYIGRKIPRPGPRSIPLPTETTMVQPIITPIYSVTPTLNKWVFCDQLARGHITLNCTDVAGLGVVTTGTAKEAWDSIQREWGRSTDMRRSHAQEALNEMTYVEGTDIQDHIKQL